MEEKARTQIVIDEQFCASDADVIFKSVDGVQFHLHRRNLEAHTGAFPGSEFSTNGEVTYLTETASILRILFQFVYPRRQPDLERMDFELVAALTEAAEKYEVFSAMPICNVRMRQFAADHPADIFAYALKHGYPALVDQIAPTLVTKPLSSVLEKLPVDFIVPWVKYHEDHNSVFEVVLESIHRRTIHEDNPNPSFLCIACYFRAFCEVQRIRHLASIPDILAAVNDKEVTNNNAPCDCRSIPFHLKLNPVLVVRLMIKKGLELRGSFNNPTR